MATYIDGQGFLTQDYTMDAADVAAQTTSYTSKGIPVLGGTGTAGGMPSLTGAMATGGYNNYAANGWQPTQGGGYVPPSPMGGGGGAGSPYAGSVGSSIGPNGVVTSHVGAPATAATQPRMQVPMNMPPMGGYDPTTAAITQDSNTNNAIALSQIPRDDLAKRALFTPGGGDLFSSLQAAGHLGNAGQYNPNTLSSGLVDGDGKPLPGNQINKDMISDPRFQQLMKLDQINGTSNAANFYQNMNGRSLSSDQAANTALLATQSSTKMKDAAELQKNLTVAQADVPSQGIKKGDLVTQQVVPGLLPGQDQVSVLPLTSYQRELANLMPDTTTDASGKVTQVMDQYGRPSYSARGNSYLQQATGLPSAADLQYLQGLKARKDAQNTTAATAQAPAATPLTGTTTGTAPAGKATSLNPLDSASLIYDNATTTLGNFLGSGPAAPYTTPAQRLADINASSVQAASTWGNAQRGPGVMADPKMLALQAASQAKPAGTRPFDAYLYQNDDNYLPPSGSN